MKEHWRAFDKKWFSKHQKTLLFLLNAPVLKYLTRYIFRIRKYDCPIDSNINRIEPNAFWYNAKKEGGIVTVTADFRADDKFSKRVYYSIRPYWWLLHYFDEFFADSYAPSLSFGFSTLTTYPQANGTDNPVDGYLARDSIDETWATIIAGAGTTALSGNGLGAGTAIQIVAFRSSASINDRYVNLIRGIACFDTSSLTSSASISSAVLSVYGSNKIDDASKTPNIDVYAATPASTTAIDSGDFQQIGSTSQTGSPISYASWNTAGYNDFTFNATGRGNVSKTGVSKFGFRNANYDVAATTPNMGSGYLRAYLNGYYSGETGTTKDPKLVVTYTISVSSASFLLNMI